MVKAQKFVVAKIFDGEIKEDDLRIVEEELPALEDGEYLTETLYLSVDPYMRAYAHQLAIGQVMIGTQIAKVIDSRNEKFPKGAFVLSSMGWRSHTLVDTNYSPERNIYILPDFGDLPLSLGLGALGMPGNTAYFGFLDICKPKRGETVVVSGAAGAVGSHVGQIAKIEGCHVIGIAGSQAKADWLKTIGFDHVINYKTTPDLRQALIEAAPNGIDCYFDNVGNEMSSTIIHLMNMNGRVSVCGSISSYNDSRPPKVTAIQTPIVRKQLKIEGFHANAPQFIGRWFEGIKQNLEWIQEGKLKYREHVTEGFENTLRALMGVMKGENIGKAVVKVKTGDTYTVNLRQLMRTFEK